MPIEVDFEGAGYLKLRGLPYAATAAEISTFFDGQVAEDQVLFGVNRDKRPSGEAYVQVPNVGVAETTQAAKNKQEVGGRYVEIFISKFDEVTSAINIKRGCTNVLTGPPGSAFLRLRGLPFASPVTEVAEFLAEFGVEVGHVTLGVEAEGGRPSGEAWVIFPSEEIANNAKTAKDKQTLGGRYVEVFTSTEEEVGRSRPGQGGWNKGGYGWGKGYGKGRNWNQGGPNLTRQPVSEDQVVGDVVEWKGHFGWITPSAPVEHAAADRRGGKLYVHKKDLGGDVAELTVGSKVQFKVYSDSSGLGAEAVVVI